MLDKLREQVIKDFTRMWSVNDEAHQIKHFTNVEICGNEIMRRLGLDFDPKLIMLVAHFHDMFAHQRHNHHELSAKWVQGTDYPIIVDLTVGERMDVFWGCLQHRASYRGGFNSKFAELMNAADRELPGDVPAMVERAVQYRIGKGMTREDAWGPAVLHIKEKFGVEGYANFPRPYIEAFRDELTQQRIDIKNL